MYWLTNLITPGPVNNSSFGMEHPPFKGYEQQLLLRIILKTILLLYNITRNKLMHTIHLMSSVVYNKIIVFIIQIVRNFFNFS